MIRLSYSAASDFLTCPRKYYYRWQLGRVPYGHAGRALTFGRAFHEAQATWWGTDGDAGERLIQAIMTWHEQSGDLSVEDRILGEILLIGYAAHWSDVALRYHMVPLVERKVETPLLRPDGTLDSETTVVAVFDAVAYNGDARTVLIEHKTTRSDVTPGSRYWDRVETNLQADLYHIVASDLGRQIDHVLWDVVRVPEFERLKATPPELREYYVKSGPWGVKGDPKKGTRLADETLEEFAARVTQIVLDNPAAYFARQTLYRDGAELDRARADLWGISQLIQAALTGGNFPRNSDSCEKYGQPCSYKPVCWNGADITDERLYSIRSRAEVDPWDI